MARKRLSRGTALGLMVAAISSHCSRRAPRPRPRAPAPPASATPQSRHRQRGLRRTPLRPPAALRDGRPGAAIDGDETILAHATQDLSRFNLDFAGKTVGAVSVNGAPGPFSLGAEELVVTPREPDCRTARPSPCGSSTSPRADEDHERVHST